MKLLKKISAVALAAAIAVGSVFVANPKESYAATSCEKVLKKNVTYKYDIDGDRDLDTIKIYTSSGDLKIKVNKCVKTLINDMILTITLNLRQKYMILISMIRVKR